MGAWDKIREKVLPTHEEKIQHLTEKVEEEKLKAELRLAKNKGKKKKSKPHKYAVRYAEDEKEDRWSPDEKHLGFLRL